MIFVSLLFAVPIIQIGVEVSRKAGWLPPRKTEPGAKEYDGRTPAVADIIDLLPSREAVANLRQIRGPRSIKLYGVRNLSALFPDVVKIKEFETRLEDESVLSEAVLSPAQYCLTRFLRTGNHLVYVGQDGWLMFKWDVAQATDPYFASRNHAADTIADVARQFQARGVKLIVMPMVDKASLYPDRLAFSAQTPFPVSNPKYDGFLARLRDQKVLVFDTTAAAVKIRRENPEASWFLATDTHWRPELAAKIAAELASFIKDSVKPGFPPVRSIYHARPVAARRKPGDLVRMLHLTGSPLFNDESIVYHEVEDFNGEPWKTDPTADVMVFGDSFTEIYGEQQAGLAENLSVALGRTVDRFGKPGPGMTQFARNVTEQLCRQPARFRAKRLVIWEFTVRDIPGADWGKVDLGLPGRD
jgi:alginate O-acetyltransferase complex protein AlgJ